MLLYKLGSAINLSTLLFYHLVNDFYCVFLSNTHSVLILLVFASPIYSKNIKKLDNKIIIREKKEKNTTFFFYAHLLQTLHVYSQKYHQTYLLFLPLSTN